MLKLKYKGNESTYSVEFQRISENIVQITGNLPIETVGFELSRENADGSWDGWDYMDFSTIYHKFGDVVQFSNDGSIYIEDETNENQLESFELSDEEKQKMKIRQEIESLKRQLSDGDYKVIKNIEAESVGEIYPYDMYELHAERQGIRDKINELELSLSNI